MSDVESDLGLDSITDSKSDSGFGHGLDHTHDRRRVQSRNRRRTRPQTRSRSRRRMRSHSVSDSETYSGLDTQCTIRVQYFEIIALSIFVLRRGIIMMNMVAIAHQMISSEWN